jgi:hypothetical protein
VQRALHVCSRKHSPATQTEPQGPLVLYI